MAALQDGLLREAVALAPATVLTFDHQPHVNVGHVEERTKGLLQTLESGL
jgi:hypothetical protein